MKEDILENYVLVYLFKIQITVIYFLFIVLLTRSIFLHDTIEIIG